MSNTSENVFNIASKDINARRTIGIIMAVVSAGLTALVYILNLAPIWGVVIFLPLLGTFLGFFQAKKKTWIAKAAQGLRDLGSGEEKIEDEELVSKLKQQGNLIVTRAVFFSAIITAAFMVILEIT